MTFIPGIVRRPFPIPPRKPSPPQNSSGQSQQQSTSSSSSTPPSPVISVVSTSSPKKTAQENLSTKQKDKKSSSNSKTKKLEVGVSKDTNSSKVTEVRSNPSSPRNGSETQSPTTSKNDFTTRRASMSVDSTQRDSPTSIHTNSNPFYTLTRNPQYIQLFSSY
jgi:hypothetical protein